MHTSTTSVMGWDDPVRICNFPVADNTDVAIPNTSEIRRKESKYLMNSEF